MVSASFQRARTSLCAIFSPPPGRAAEGAAFLRGRRGGGRNRERVAGKPRVASFSTLLAQFTIAGRAEALNSRQTSGVKNAPHVHFHSRARFRRVGLRQRPGRRRRKANAQAASKYRSGNQVTITKRSFLDPGNVVPVGSQDRYCCLCPTPPRLRAEPIATTISPIGCCRRISACPASSADGRRLETQRPGESPAVCFSAPRGREASDQSLARST